MFSGTFISGIIYFLLVEHKNDTETHLFNKHIVPSYFHPYNIKIKAFFFFFLKADKLCQE